MSIFSLLILIGIQQSPLDERNLSLSSRSTEQKLTHKKLLNAYAPDFYHDSNFLNKKLQVLKPSGTLSDPYFDGDADFSNNPENILLQTEDENGKIKGKYDLKPRVFSSIQETNTHYYLTYLTYHARDDTGDDAHGQDTETVMIAIKKNNKELGELEFLVTNSHGYPRIYAPDAELESKMRSRLKSKFNLKDRLAMEILYGSGIDDDLLGTPTDRMAQAHHRSGRIQIEPRPALFITAEGHAIYKLNPEAWRDGYGEGYIYTCVPEGLETSAHCFPMRPKKDRIVGYSLRDMDELWNELYPRDLSKLKPEELTKIIDQRSKMFEGAQIDFETKVGDGNLKLRKDLPRSFIRGTNDEKAAANLPFDWSMKTGIRLALPHLVHQFLQPDNAQISDHYLFNSAVEYSDLKNKNAQISPLALPPLCSK